MKDAANSFENGRLRGFKLRFDDLLADVERYLDQLEALIQDPSQPHLNANEVEKHHCAVFDIMAVSYTHLRAHETR